MRYLIQTKVGAQVAEVHEQLDDAAIVGLEEGFQDQAGEQLGLRVEFGTIAVRIEWKGVGSNGQRLFGDAQRRLAGDTHIPLFVSSCP